MAYVPLEVMTEIICRLPVKSLLCLRCVSKSWRSLIDDPNFINLHLNKSIKTQSHVSVILREGSELHFVDFNSFYRAAEFNHPLMCYSNRIRVLGSCNGLLCICNVADDIAFWNPSIRKHFVLPFMPVDRRRDSGMCLCGGRVYGFGYDSLHDDYKLVRISQFVDLERMNSEAEVRVYSLRKNVWKSIQDMPYVLCYTSKMGVLVDSSLHWVVARNLETDEVDLVVGFNLVGEDFREVPLPEFGDGKFKMDVGVLGECLCLTANYRDLRVDVWVMKEYGVKESWARLFTVSQLDRISFFKCLRPLAFSKSGCQVLLEKDQRKLVWYDLRSQQLKNAKVHNMPERFHAEIYMESLVSVVFYREIDGKIQNLLNVKSGKKRDDFLSEGFKLVL